MNTNKQKSEEKGRRLYTIIEHQINIKIILTKLNENIKTSK